MFIHGLGGDAFKTWSNDKNHKNSWPYWLGEAFPDVGVWSVEYAASISKWARVLGWFSAKKRDAGYSMALPDRALELLDAMQLDGIGKRPVLFICHSLGGLVAKQLLRKSHDTRDSAKHQLSTNIGAVLFLGTPHGGSFLATILDWARLPFLTTRSIDDLAAHSPYLADLNGWYREFAPDANIRTKTYYETRGAFGLVKVVNRGSSDSGVGEAAVGLDKDHFSIAKPDKPKGGVCDAASTLLRDYVLLRPLRPVAPATAALGANALPPSINVTVNVDHTLLGKASPARIPHQLPPAAEQFFGRSAEKAKVIARLRYGKNTAIVAPAGLGKTALAAEAVREVVGTIDAPLATSPYPNGVVFLDLYAVHGNLDRALHALATTLMGEDFMENAQPRDRATAACRGKRILVIIEGGEEADGVGDHGQITDLFGALAPENRRLLLTRLSTQSAPAESVSLKEALDAADAAALLDSLTQGCVTAEVRTRVLALLEGHPLAITWAGNLLARGDESPERLATDWATESLPALSDPEKATRTLEWLFNRSVRGLDDTGKQALVTAGLLARAPFPLVVIVAALGKPEDEQSCRIALRTLVQRGLLQIAQQSQLANEPDHWQFTHVLGYRFARDETGSDAAMRLRLATALDAQLKDMLTAANAQPTAHQVPRQLEHISALLRTDFDQSLWYPLANKVLFVACDRLTELCRLSLANAALNAVQGWCARLPQATGEQPRWRREQSALLNRQGDVRRAQGDLAGALVAFQASMDVVKALAASDPSNAGWQRDLTVSQNNVGNVHLAQGDLVKALVAFQASMDIIKALAASDPSNAAWQRNLSVSHTKVGDVCLVQGDLAGALAAFQASMDIFKALTARDPSSAGWQRDLIVSHHKIGDVRRAQGDLPGALAAFRAAIDLAKALAESDSSNAGWQRDLSLSFTLLAQIFEQQGERALAVEHAEKSLLIDERLAALDPTNVMWQEDVEVSRAMVARLKAAGE